MSTKKHILNIEREVTSTIQSKIELKIEPYTDGFDLTATEQDGEKWYLLRFGTDGSTNRQYDIPESLGFELDEEDRLVIT
jgi:hypothetical protein